MLNTTSGVGVDRKVGR